MGLFLQGQTVADSPDIKFDKRANSIWDNCTMIPYFHSWGKKNRRGVNDYNGYLFPKHELVKQHPDWNWQVQVWEIYCNEMIHAGGLEDVLHNRMMSENNGSIQFRPIDLGFWNHGLHDWGWWDRPPFGVNYFNTMVRQWLEMKDTVPTPTVWVSMNNNCRALINEVIVGTQKADNQALMIDEVMLQKFLIHSSMLFRHFSYSAFHFFVSVFFSLIRYLSDPTTLSVCPVIAGELVHAQAAPRREAAILGRGECVALPTALRRIRGWSAREDVRGHRAG